MLIASVCLSGQRPASLTPNEYTGMYIHMNTNAALLHLLADPTRLKIVECLRFGESTVGQVVAQVGIRQSGVSRHLHILHDAGVVQVRADGQRRLYTLRPEPFAQLEQWAAGYRALWSDRLDRFAGALTAVQLGRDRNDT